MKLYREKDSFGEYALIATLDKEYLESRRVDIYVVWIEVFREIGHVVDLCELNQYALQFPDDADAIRHVIAVVDRMKKDYRWNTIRLDF
jgi:hypothetical protein